MKFLLLESELAAALPAYGPLGGGGVVGGVEGREENLVFKIMIVKKSSGNFTQERFIFSPPFSPHHFKPLKLYTSLHLDVLRLGKVN